MRWLTLLLRLYPAAWRERYEAEFVALIEARGLRAADVFDMLLGAWDARRVAYKPVLAGGDMTALDNSRNSSLVSSVAIVGGLAAIFLTWVVIFMFGLGFTEIALVPWDTWDPARRPPTGSLSRTVNDLFENTPGALLPSFTLIGIHVMLLVKSLRQFDFKPRIIWQFVLYNGLFVLGLSLVLGLGIGINNWLFGTFDRSSADIGYHRSLAFLILLIPVLYLWIRAQRRVHEGRWVKNFV